MNVKLTEPLVLGKTRMSRLEDIRNLNVWGQELEDVSILNSMPNVEVLSLSVNKISSLRDFCNCKKLQELYLRRNLIEDLEELRYLQDLADLRVLWLSDNPCALRPDYRSLVICLLPSLHKLDNREISAEERASLPLGRPFGGDAAPSPPADVAAAPRSQMPTPPLQQPAPVTALPPSYPAASSPPMPATEMEEPAASLAGFQQSPSLPTLSPPAAVPLPAGMGLSPQQAAASGLEAAAAAALTLDPMRGLPHMQATPPSRNSSARSVTRRQSSGLARGMHSPEEAGGGVVMEHKASTSVIYAVMALLGELDADALLMVQRDVEQRLHALGF